MNRLLFSTLLFLGAFGCAGPRFQQHVTTRFAREEVRKLETPNLEVYYVASQRENAYRLVAKLERCLKSLQAHARTGSRRVRPVVYLTPAVLNNAYVQPSALGRWTQEPGRWSRSGRHRQPREAGSRHWRTRVLDGLHRD
jgi:hypothetical protein